MFDHESFPELDTNRAWDFPGSEIDSDFLSQKRDTAELLKRLATTAGFGCVWIFKSKALSFQALVPSDYGTIQ